MPQPLPRSYRRQLEAEDHAKVGRILSETQPREDSTSAEATAAGDWRRLRGVPAIGRGVAGAIRGTPPHQAVIAKERR